MSMHGQNVVPFAQRVVVMRHGERRDAAPDAPVEGDPSLTEKGKADVAQAAEKLRKVLGADAARDAILVVSPFTRCVQTAEALQRFGVGTSQRMLVDRSLCEVFGPARIKTSTAPALPRATVAASYGALPPWGESISDAHTRFVESFLDNADRFMTSELSSASLTSDTFTGSQGSPMVPAAVTARATNFGRSTQASSGLPFRHRVPGDGGAPTRRVGSGGYDVVLVTHGDALSAIVGQYYPARTVYEAEFLSFLVMKRYHSTSHVFHVDESSGVNWIVDGLDREPEDPHYLALLRTVDGVGSDGGDSFVPDSDDDVASDGDECERAIAHSSINRRVTQRRVSQSNQPERTSPQPSKGASPAPDRRQSRGSLPGGNEVPVLSAPSSGQSAPSAEGHVRHLSLGSSGGRYGGSGTATGFVSRTGLPLRGAGPEGRAPAQVGVSPFSNAVVGMPATQTHHRDRLSYSGAAQYAATDPTGPPSDQQQLPVTLAMYDEGLPVSSTPHGHPKGGEGCRRRRSPNDTPLQSSANTGNGTEAGNGPSQDATGNLTETTNDSASYEAAPSSPPTVPGSVVSCCSTTRAVTGACADGEGLKDTKARVPAEEKIPTPVKVADPVGAVRGAAETPRSLERVLDVAAPGTCELAGAALSGKSTQAAAGLESAVGAAASLPLTPDQATAAPTPQSSISTPPPTRSALTPLVTSPSPWGWRGLAMTLLIRALTVLSQLPTLSLWVVNSDAALYCATVALVECAAVGLLCAAQRNPLAMQVWYICERGQSAPGAHSSSAVDSEGQRGGPRHGTSRRRLGYSALLTEDDLLGNRAVPPTVAARTRAAPATVEAGQPQVLSSAVTRTSALDDRAALITLIMCAFFRSLAVAIAALVLSGVCVLVVGDAGTQWTMGSSLSHAMMDPACLLVYAIYLALNTWRGLSDGKALGQR